MMEFYHAVVTVSVRIFVSVNLKHKFLGEMISCLSYYETYVL